MKRNLKLKLKKSQSKMMTEYSSTKEKTTKLKASHASNVSEKDTMPMPVQMRELLSFLKMEI